MSVATESMAAARTKNPKIKTGRPNPRPCSIQPLAKGAKFYGLGVLLNRSTEAY